MLLQEICTPEVAQCTAETSVLAAARLMRTHHVGALVIVDTSDDGPVPVGLITDRDIVIEVLAAERDPATVSVRSIMRTPVIVARASEQISHAIERMSAHGVRRIPVVDEHDQLIGILTLDDLLKQLASDAVAIAEIVAREQNREHRQRR
jgi:CBS domain-containing protein